MEPFLGGGAGAGQNQPPAQRLQNPLHEDNFGWAPVFQDYKQILEQLKCPDEMIVYEAVMSLQNSLSIAQENTLSNFAVDQYIPALLEILKRPPITDFSNEINMFATQCLTNLMDIFPNICNTIVTHGGVKCFAQVLEQSMGFIDLNEACIKAIEKISIENPYAILTSGAMGPVLNMMDFFEITTQKRIISILLNISKTSASETDLNEHLLPLMPCLCMFLHNRGGPDNSAKVETVSTIVLRIFESIFRFISPASQIDKLAQQFDKIGQTGIIDAILQTLEEYSQHEGALRESMASASPSKSDGMQGATIQTTSVQKMITNITVQNFLKILSLCSTYSIGITKAILDCSILKLVEVFLPSSEDQKKLNFSAESFPFIVETITLLDSILPSKEDKSDLQHALILGGISGGKGFEQIQQAQSRFDDDKRALYKTPISESQVVFAAERLLPKIFNVHENNIQSTLRSKTLSTIDKLILLFNEELLNNFIEPYSFAKFIYSNLRSNQLSSIQLCLQMVDKLMKCNPRSYTLPLIREGVTPFIKQLSTIEQLEKLTGLSLVEVEQPAATAESKEDMLFKAKAALLREASEKKEDGQARAMFEETIQKYMELAKVSREALGGVLPSNRAQAQTGKAVVTLAETLLKEYFDNEDFIRMINDQCGDELQTLTKLKQLSADIITEAKRYEFDFQKNKEIMKAVADTLTKQKSLMSYELKESGLLDALKMYVSMTPKQVELLVEQQKSVGEEVKHSEEIQMNAMIKNANQITKKQARSFIQRLKVFLHVMLNKVNDKQPIAELVNLCHDLISQSDYIIFEQAAQPDIHGASAGSLHYSLGGGPYGHQISDPNQSLSALKQLTRRLRVNLVYDPSQASQTIQKQSRDAAMSGVSLEGEPLLAPTSLHKSTSHHPAFMHLADQSALGAGQGPEPQSKVYQKRNFLYTELKQVLVSVEQCASLALLEDFLRNRIKNLDDVKALKVPPPQPSYYGQRQDTSSLQGRISRQIIERSLDRLRDIIESTSSKEEMASEIEDFHQSLIDEILEVKELSEVDHREIVRQLEVASLQIMDDYFAEHGGEGSLDDGGAFMETEEKLYEFQRSINRLREKFRNRLQEEKEVEKKDTPTKKEPIPSDDAEMKDQSEDKSEESSSNRPGASAMRDDVDMTDEDVEELQRREELEHRRFQRSESDANAIMLTPPDQQLGKEVINEDLEELIKANGDDIEYEFYVASERMLPNQTIYELLKQVEMKARKQKEADPLSMSASIGKFLDQLHGRDSDQVTIHFAIKDKHDNLQKQRKDSVLEFSSKRDRTKSEAVEEISVSSVNQFVTQLIDKEFSVFNKSPLDLSKSQDKHYKEKQQLESALKILKVLNYLCRNMNLFSGQGIKFLICKQNSPDQDEEMKEEGFQDLDLQIGLSQIHSNMYHHHKLDSFILKNIQDPFNLISGAFSELLNQIFKNCSFLFPFQTRQLYFKLISFIGSIDMNRSIYFLRQFLKQKLGKLPSDEKNPVKIQKQKVIVDRNRVLDCTLSILGKVSNRAFLEVEYKDEIGTGLGPTLEFYCLLAQELKNYKMPTSQTSIWRQSQADNTLFPNAINIVKMPQEELQKIYEVFRLAGMITAKSISDDRLVDLPFSPLFWDLVLGKKMNIFDLERMDPGLFKIFADLQILANKKKDIDKAIFLDQDHKTRQLNNLKTSQGAKVEDLSLVFTLPGFDEIELKLGGKDEYVTLDNLQDYIDLTMHYMFHEGIKVQIQAFKKGFNQIFSVENLRPFATIELEDMICGTQRNEDEWTSSQKLSEFIVPAHGFHQKSAQYINFLRFITELDKDERRKFLKFVTGSPRLPIGGFGALDPKLTLVLKKPDQQVKHQPHDLAGASSQQLLIDEILPSVMTCQNYVKLPAYSTFEVLKNKFEQAYNEGANNFTLS